MQQIKYKTNNINHLAFNFVLFLFYFVLVNF